MTRAILLAAGRGSRLGELTADRPKCMVSLGGEPLLGHQLRVLRSAGMTESLVIGGYRGEALPRGDGLEVRHNARWGESNMVRTLLCAEDWLTSGPCLVAYTDILYGPTVVRRVVACPEPLAIAYDRAWLEQWRQRFDDPLSDAETFRADATGAIVDIGRKPRSLDEVQGQYMGLLGLTPSGWGSVHSFLETRTEGEIDRLDMTTLLGALLQRGVRLQAIENEGPWGEVDSPSDLALYERTGLVSQLC